MKVALQDGRRFVLRLDKGEEFFIVLADFLSKNKITAASFNGIGSCSGVEIGFYNEFLKQYRRKPFFESFEIVSLTGNAGLEDGKPVIHAHGVFSRNTFDVIAGHVFKLDVGATCEIFLIKLEGALERKMNSDFNLNLLA